MSKTSELSAMSLAELTGMYNQYAAKPIKRFSCSRDAAIAKIMALQPKAKPAASTPTKKLGIGKLICDMLALGDARDAIVVAVMAILVINGHSNNMAGFLVYFYLLKRSQNHSDWQGKNP